MLRLNELKIAAAAAQMILAQGRTQVHNLIQQYLCKLTDPATATATARHDTTRPSLSHMQLRYEMDSKLLEEY